MDVKMMMMVGQSTGLDDLEFQPDQIPQSETLNMSKISEPMNE